MQSVNEFTKLMTTRYGKLIEVEGTIQGLMMVKVDTGSELLVGVLPVQNIKGELNAAVEVSLDHRGQLIKVRGIIR